MSGFISAITSFFISFILLFESVPLAWTPVLTVDAAEKQGEVSTKATGFLYGLAEEGVPSSAITDSLDISSVSQKVVDGLQHPTGDIDHVAPQLSECDYTVVYLQDSFSTWYYDHKNILDSRAAGTYDWREYLTETYFPIVEEKVKELMTKPYADKLVYCIFNECDNAIWFGNYIDGQVHFDEVGRANFYEAWKMTYNLVKSIDPDARIGGPGYFDYETTKIRGFMEYCTENGCVPEIMIYHELAWWSIPDWHKHVEDYRKAEKELGISALPIIVTEYGTMEDCGNPATMLHYIIAMEKSGVYGDMAFWRLANNLNDTCADDNSPNSNWWLYRKYAELEGQLLEVTSKSQQEYDYRNRLDGIAALRSDGKAIDMIVTGSDKRQSVKLKNLSETDLGSEVTVTVEAVYYKGLTGIVSSPVTVRKYNARLNRSTLNVNLPAADSNSVYFITVEKAAGEIKPVRNTKLPVRYEFEEGKLLGGAYTYDSAYATTGETAGMTGGFENEGDGVKITFSVPESGYYDLDFIYGNSNDGRVPDDRDYTKAVLTLDGDEQTILLPNTIKSEYTDCYNKKVYLCMGLHTLEMKHGEGTFVLDSLLVTPCSKSETITLLRDGDRAYIAVAPRDGYYTLATGQNTAASIDGIDVFLDGMTEVYLRRGLNQLELRVPCDKLVIYDNAEGLASQSFTAEDFTLSEGATISTDKYGTAYIEGISSNGGKAQIKVNAPEEGTYRVTLCYANNQEGGYHDYNVDLIEALLTVEANGISQDMFCRNTYSRFTYKTMTFSLELRQGENTVTFSSSGNTRFDSRETSAPQIAGVTVNPVQ